MNESVSESANETDKKPESWSSMKTLKKKGMLRQYLKALDMPPNTYKSLYNNIWKSIQTKLMKSKHVKIKNDNITSIKGLEKKEGKWLFNETELFR